MLLVLSYWKLDLTTSRDSLRSSRAISASHPDHDSWWVSEIIDCFSMDEPSPGSKRAGSPSSSAPALKRGFLRSRAAETGHALQQVANLRLPVEGEDQQDPPAQRIPRHQLPQNQGARCAQMAIISDIYARLKACDSTTDCWEYFLDTLVNACLGDFWCDRES